jgi:type I restriction enzyme S subunit
MITFPKYKAYQDSGVAWLNEVPSHWKVQLGRGYLKPKKVKNTGNKVKTVLSLSYGKIIVKPEEKLYGLVPESFETYQIVEPGDIIVRATDLQNDHTSLRIGLVEDYGIITSAYLCLQPSGEMDSRFAYYLLHAYDLLKVYYGMGSGLRQNLDYTDFKYLPLTVPDLEEQKRIAEFLDRKTAEIDEAIAHKQRLIELLQEQKAILINQAVTKGLNPDAPMRDSGIGWLGKIPEHWQIKRLKHLSFVQGGITLGKTYSGHQLINYPYLRVANVQYGYFKLDDVAELSLPKREAERYFIQPGDILVTEGGDIDKLGRGTVWEGQIEACIHQNHIFAIRLNKEIASEYFISLAMSCDYARKYFIDTAVKTTNLASTNRTKLGNLPIPIPSIAEQEEIVEHSRRIDAEFNEGIEMISNEIAQIENFRRVSIAEAVTGKIKV